MPKEWIVAGFLVGGSILWLSVLYMWGSFSYDVSNTAITVRWRILRFVPFAQRIIRLSAVRGIRRFDPRRDWFPGAEILGNVIVKAGLIIETDRPIINRIFVTPDAPEIFIRDVETRIQESAREQPARGA